MSIIQGASTFGSTNVPMPAHAGVIAAVTYTHAFTKLLAAGDIIELGALPPGVKLLDAILVADDIDTGAGIVLDLGIMSGDYAGRDQTRTSGDEIIAASNVGQAGGVVRPSKASAFRIPVSNRDRGIGLKVKAAPAGFQAGTVSVTLFYHAP